MDYNTKVHLILSKVHSGYSIFYYITIKLSNINDEDRKLELIKKQLFEGISLKFYNENIKTIKCLRYSLDSWSRIILSNKILKFLCNLYSSVSFCEKEFFEVINEKLENKYDSDGNHQVLSKLIKYKKDKEEIMYPINENWMDDL